ncbi:Tyrosine phosphatase family protein [Andreprevotia lacus DSM 23236]|jgi:protein tyrosine phosphatase (PTP) superfamily phosphohydrolase (DUF442 family)|uniref:Tyrosine phosphatase family protein n=1 Tax=Andreprevotia lacus DSM 23236 TaxID=1121001 RepID=A0A1W1XR52_9NEIS|nr:dual specificity protein phosphatase family protein [Andreprevotia lacus]SMC26376.1 Tyrosine phosphatase family protein [Andreprevotia lacus DSM 23236]
MSDPRFVSLLLLALLAAPVHAEQAAVPAHRPAEWAQPVGNGPISNLYRITPQLYRSAALTRDDVAQLKQLGVRKVISFRAFHSDDKILADSQIEILRIPINTWNIRDQDMIAALRALHHLDRDGPVLIHCQHGADRTGLVSALYRVVYQGWSKQQALDELENGGYGFHAMWQNIKRYMNDVDIAKLRSAVDAAG